MKIEKELAKKGIYPICEIKYEEKIQLARFVTNKLSQFPFLEAQYNELLMRLVNCTMYFAKKNVSIRQGELYLSKQCYLF